MTESDARALLARRVVEAVLAANREAWVRDAANAHNHPSHWAGRIAHAVLDAALTAEPDGPWKVECDGEDDGHWWTVTRTNEDGTFFSVVVDTQENATACANALNLLAALKGGKDE